MKRSLFLLFLSFINFSNDAMDYEASKKKLYLIALRTAGYSEDEIKNLNAPNVSEITSVTVIVKDYWDDANVTRVYDARLKDGGCIIADYCKYKGKETTKCTRHVPRTQVPILLENSKGWFNTIETYCENQKK